MNTCESDGCSKALYGRRFCLEHYNRDHTPKRIYNDHDRFFSNLYSVGEDCWVWAGRTIKGGYGQFLGAGKLRLAHRWSYEYFVGDIPKGLTIDHICDNPPCVNPNHLQPMTQRENNYKSKKYTGNRTHCKNGHEYTPENTYIRPDTKGLRTWRDCKKCIYLRGRKAYLKRIGET